MWRWARPGGRPLGCFKHRTRIAAERGIHDCARPLPFSHVVDVRLRDGVPSLIQQQDLQPDLHAVSRQRALRRGLAKAHIPTFRTYSIGRSPWTDKAPAASTRNRRCRPGPTTRLPGSAAHPRLLSGRNPALSLSAAERVRTGVAIGDKVRCNILRINDLRTSARRHGCSVFDRGVNESPRG